MSGGGSHPGGREVAREKIDLSDVVAQANLGRGRELSLTDIGYRLALLLLLYLAVVTAVLLADYWVHSPLRPDPATLSADGLATYKALYEDATERTLRFFDVLVFKSFLPVFTAVLGYVFGSRRREKEPS